MTIAAAALALASCDPVQGDSPDFINATAYEPILMQRADLEQSIKLKGARSLQNTGKIYVKDPFLFINEKYEGVHIYNNVDPTDPKNIGFIQIPGNVDIAIKDNIIYADNSVDLVALEWDGTNLTVKDRDRDVFPEITPPDFGAVPTDYLPENRPANTVIVKWIEK